MKWFVAFTAVFAVGAAIVFWGTWSPDFAPVMPDSPICYSPDWFRMFCRDWLTTGKFHPLDLRYFIGTPYFWQELNYVIPLYLSGLAVAYFLRGRGLPLIAAYGAGLLLAFCGYWMTLFSAGHGGWFWWMSYGIWVFGLIDRAVRKDKLKNWLLAGTVVGWASYWQVDLCVLFSLLFAAFFVFCEIENRHKFSWPKSLIGPAVALVVFLLVGSAAMWNALVFDRAQRIAQIGRGDTVANVGAIDEKEKRWIFITNWSLPFEETCEFWSARGQGDTSCPFTLALGRRAGKDVKPYVGALGRPIAAKQGNYRQHSLYVGLVTCLLALLGFGMSFTKADERNRRTVWFFAASALVCYLLSLGRNCAVVYRVIYALPIVDFVRCPVKWHHLTELCIVVLSGFGLAALARFCATVKTGAAAKLAPLIVPAVILIGVADLVRVDRLYCAPVDLRAAKRQHAKMEMTYLPRAQFAHPEVRKMLEAGRLVDLGAINRELEAVGVLTPFPRERAPLPPMSTAAWLSVLSILTSLAAVTASATLRHRKISGEIML